MRAPRIHPYYADVRSLSNYMENNSRYSLAYLLRTRCRRFLLLISLLMIILICGLVIPLTIILSRDKKTHQSPPPTTTDITLNSTTNTTTFDDSTINIDTSITNTVTDIYFLSNNTLENDINSSIILTTDTIIDTNWTKHTFTSTPDSIISSDSIRRKFNH
ncbi:unnamed protein product [Rotaria sp. Silwood2]|nr:unnamed protein product [Rotaria sp. Silwood2]CAF2639457.1 unnamed protein product [Rotaria sp. Silwood2]CAF3075533.1 unnamed protein product [Rotaria sp. Silwood2]CAF4193076.1 unnamed protein product [Rotaria sp. Silwood2]CAF4441381.1 unnamed protein product [Rotaria sp. Silwood2]